MPKRLLSLALSVFLAPAAFALEIRAGMPNGTVMECESVNLYLKALKDYGRC